MKAMIKILVEVSRLAHRKLLRAAGYCFPPRLQGLPLTPLKMTGA